MTNQKNEPEDFDTFEKVQQLKLQKIIKNDSAIKIFQIPIDFEFQPVQILSKQLTKLNNKYSQRILYLGPRCPNSLILHKKYSRNQEKHITNHYAYNSDEIPKYQFEFNKVLKSSMFMENYHKNQYYKTKIYYRAFEGMNPTLTSDQLQYTFDASFQSSNLDCVVKVNQKQYDLFLRID